jgi:putative hydroxymethylpyrimidine transport system permease protein
MILALRYMVIFITIIVLWELVVLWLNLPAFIVPKPNAVFQSLFSHGRLIVQNAWPTILESLLGFILGGLSGVWMSLCLIYFHWTRYWFLPLLITSQALPIFAIAPLLVLWFGYGMLSKIIVAMLMIFFPVASAFYDGLRRTSREWLNLGKVMNASRWRLLWRIQVPAALPALASGLRMAATFAPMGAVIGEWVGSSRGLGFLMLNANARMQIDLVFAVLFVLILLTLILYFVVDQTLRKFIFWKGE